MDAIRSLSRYFEAKLEGVHPSLLRVAEELKVAVVFNDHRYDPRSDGTLSIRCTWFEVTEATIHIYRPSPVDKNFILAHELGHMVDAKRCPNNYFATELLKEIDSSQGSEWSQDLLKLEEIAWYEAKVILDNEKVSHNRSDFEVFKEHCLDGYRRLATKPPQPILDFREALKNAEII
jgi:hypothetical protein